MDYRTKGVCSQSIHFDIEDNKIHTVSFVGGCNGNLQGIPFCPTSPWTD